eukprot:77892-Pelagomonas_calceolata.AAC.3
MLWSASSNRPCFQVCSFLHTYSTPGCFVDPASYTTIASFDHPILCAHGHQPLRPSLKLAQQVVQERNTSASRPLPLAQPSLPARSNMMV